MIAYEVQRDLWAKQDRRRETVRAWIVTGVVAGLAIGAVWGLGLIQTRGQDKLLAQRERCEQAHRETILTRDLESGVMRYRCGRQLRLIVVNDD